MAAVGITPTTAHGCPYTVHGGHAQARLLLALTASYPPYKFVLFTINKDYTSLLLYFYRAPFTFTRNMLSALLNTERVRAHTHPL